VKRPSQSAFGWLAIFPIRSAFARCPERWSERQACIDGDSGSL
jgi:hypothetical protein